MALLYIQYSKCLLCLAAGNTAALQIAAIPQLADCIPFAKQLQGRLHTLRTNRPKNRQRLQQTMGRHGPSLAKKAAADDAKRAAKLTKEPAKAAADDAKAWASTSQKGCSRRCQAPPNRPENRQRLQQTMRRQGHRWQKRLQQTMPKALPNQPRNRRRRY